MANLILGGFVIAALVVLAPLVLILGLIAVIALRGDPDDAGGRAAAIYLSFSTAAALVTAVVAATALTVSVVELQGNNDERRDGGWFNYAPDSDMAYSSEGDFEEFPMEDMDFSDGPGETERRGGPDDGAVQGIVGSLIGLLVAAAILRFHWPRLDAVRQRALAGSAALRVHDAYCYVLCFAAVLVVLSSVSVLLYDVVALAVPDTLGAHDRGDVVESAIPLLVLTLLSIAIFRVHWTRVTVPSFLQPPSPPEAPPA